MGLFREQTVVTFHHEDLGFQGLAKLFKLVKSQVFQGRLKMRATSKELMFQGSQNIKISTL